jgi:hypothetical protein
MRQLMTRQWDGAAMTIDDQARGAQVTAYCSVEREKQAVHNWRVAQLRRLGVPGTLAEVHADRVDWHQIARLLERGCPLRLALRIAG